MSSAATSTSGASPRNQDKRLTTGATETLHNGRFDWVYEEEFGMAQAWNWSPDSRHLAYWQVDESAEPTIQLSNYEGAHPEWEKLRIPAAGGFEPDVRIGVVDVQTGKQVWLDTGATGDFYIPRIYWTSAADTLAVLELNRKQNTLRLFFFNVQNGGRPAGADLDQRHLDRRLRLLCRASRT